MILICKNCEREFNSDKRNKKFCSKCCYTKWQKGKLAYPNIVNKRGRRQQKGKVSQCILCGKEFKHWAGREAKYCSKECWQKRNPPKLKECLYCGKEFWSYDKKQQYCSHKCYGLHKRELIKGNNSHFWRGGKTKLSKLLRCREEYNEWRDKVFQRDNYTCQKCRIKSGLGKRVYLHAHHIKPFAEYPLLRLNINNGITLCKNCHLLEHSHRF